jgi:transposase
MMSDPAVRQQKARRRRLAPSQKYEMFVAVLANECTQREAAERWGVDRSTVLHTCRVAKQGALDALAAAVPGRPGQSAEAARIAELSAQVDRLRAALAEQAVALHLHEGKASWG